MAKTVCNLYRSVMDKSFKNIKVCVYPGDGVLDPRWEPTQYYSKKLSRMVISNADVDVVLGKDNPDVLSNGKGTSLHDVPKWFPNIDFFIPEGTEYSDEILIRKDAKQKISSYNPNLKGFHYQLEPRTRMTVLTFKGYLNNMARAAVVRQCELAGIKI